MPKIKKRVVVALSGGVDSSVAAHLLVKQGYEVIGIFMKNWHDESVTISNECPWVEDSYDAMIVSEKLSIPFQTIDLSKDYQKKIVDYMFNVYKNGSTPNPDVLCNREIKFDVFLKIAMNLGADYIATGHYCRVVKNENGVYRLLTGKDLNKDQSYFLCQLSQEQLSKTLFPIGEMNKNDVRLIAKKEGLITAEKKDSQGLCFIGKVKLPDFLQQQLKKKKGKVIEIPSDSLIYKKNNNYSDHSYKNLKSLSKSYDYKPEDGKLVGEHNGAHFFTNGQRKGLSIGGNIAPLYVIKTDVINNVIYVGEGKNHPGLLSKVLFIEKNEIHLIESGNFFKSDTVKKLQARIRYRQPLQDVALYFKTEGVFLLFKNEQLAITRGQFAVWYKNDELIGSGVID